MPNVRFLTSRFGNTPFGDEIRIKGEKKGIFPLSSKEKKRLEEKRKGGK